MAPQRIAPSAVLGGLQNNLLVGRKLEVRLIQLVKEIGSQIAPICITILAANGRIPINSAIST